ncbi:MAG: hypothetical protein RL722_451 [Pseudomonadota bacterium]
MSRRTAPGPLAPPRPVARAAGLVALLGSLAAALGAAPVQAQNRPAPGLDIDPALDALNPLGTAVQAGSRRAEAALSGNPTEAERRDLVDPATGSFRHVVAPRNAATAPPWFFTLGAEATATSNVGMEPLAQASSDLVLGLRPAVQIDTRSAGWRLSGQAALQLRHYAQNRRGDEALPSADLDGSARLVDRWLWLDGRIAAAALPVSPFVSAVPGSRGVQESTRWTLGPRLDHELDPLTRVSGHALLTHQHQTGGDLSVDSSSRTLDQALSWSRLPRPLGLRIEAQSQETTVPSLSAPVFERRTLRGVLGWSADPQLVVDLRGGHDSSTWGINHRSGPLSGAGLTWLPSPRSRLELNGEHHALGTDWRLSASHRSPGLALSLEARREFGSSATLLGRLGNGGRVAELLDQMFATRITDPLLRAAAVQDFITRRGLGETLADPVALYSDRAQENRRLTLTAGLMGVRHVVSLSLYRDTSLDLPGDPLLSGLLSGDARQTGWSLGLNRRLDLLTSADASLSGSRATGLNANAGRDNRELALRLTLNHELTPRTQASAGLRRVLQTTSDGGRAREVALTVGVQHRF